MAPAEAMVLGAHVAVMKGGMAPGAPCPRKPTPSPGQHRWGQRHRRACCAPMHISACSLATRPARPSNPPTRTGWMPKAKNARLEEDQPQTGILIAIERRAYDEVRSCPIGRFGPWNQR